MFTNRHILEMPTRINEERNLYEDPNESIGRRLSFSANAPFRDAYSRIETPDTIGWTDFRSYRSVAKDTLQNQESAGAISSTALTKDADRH